MNSYYKKVQDLMRNFPRLTSGEAHMIALKLIRPDLYSHVVGSDVDPTNDDRRLQRYKQVINSRWYRGGREYEEMCKPERKPKEKPEVININLDLDWPFF